MLDRNPFPATVAEFRRTLDRAYDTVRANLRRVGDSAGRVVARAGAIGEKYVGEKIKRRVKPPIVLALAVAGVALIVALVAVFRT